mgnify:CR=1 FL=1
MANEIPTYTQQEYESGFIDFYKPFNLSLAPAGSSLEQQTGINVKNISEQSDKLDTNPSINKLIDPDYDSSNDLQIFSGTSTGFGDSMKYVSYETMIKQAGFDDRSDNGFNIASLASPLGILGALGSSNFEFGKTLTGPTGKKVFSIGGFSETALKKHYENFYKTYIEYDTLSSDGSDPNLTHFNKDFGFAMTFGNNHFSRAPNQMYYDGLKSHLSSDDHNAHMMLKGMEALGKGLDPKGYRLDGENEDNNGAVKNASVSKGIGRVTEDGYFTYVANNGFGYSKSKLYGGNLTQDIASNMGIDGDTLVKAMGIARSNKDMTVSQALNELLQDNSFNPTTSITSFTDVKTEIAKYVPGEGIASPMPTKPVESTRIETGDPQPSPDVSPATVTQQNVRDADAARQKAMDDRQAEKEDNQAKAQEGKETFAQKIKRGGGFQEGGVVDDELVNQTSDNEINVQEMGFVGDKTPDQVTDIQSVADDVPLNVRDEDYIINVAAIENVGVRNLTNMVQRGLRNAAQAGVEIIDIPADIPEKELVKILASDAEFRVPKNLVPFIGKSTLERINDSGKPEVEKRSRNLKEEMKELDEKRPQIQQAREGGSIQIPLGERFLRQEQGFANGGEVDGTGYEQVSEDFKDKLIQFNKKKRNRTERDNFIKSLTDEEALALTFLTETVASTTPLPTMQKIGDVIMNRVNDRQFEFKNVNSIKDVLLQRTSRGTGTKMVAFDGLEPTSLNARISEILSGKAPDAIEKVYSAAINTLDTEPDLEQYRLPFNVMYYKKPNSGSSWHDNDPELSYVMQDGGHDFYGRHFGPETLGDEVGYIPTPRVNTK